jgi:hypothetical protein
MKVQLKKDWNFHKAGDVVDVFEPTGKNWIASGIADPVIEVERRDIEVEAADSPLPEQAERAVRRHQARRR